MTSEGFDQLIAKSRTKLIGMMKRIISRFFSHRIFGAIREQDHKLRDSNTKQPNRKFKIGADLIHAPHQVSLTKSRANKIAVGVKVIHPNSTLVGSIVVGSVKKVVDYGIFIRFATLDDGLLHKNDLPSDLKYTFKDVLTKGKNVKVILKRITEKGIELKWPDCNQ